MNQVIVITVLAQGMGREVAKMLAARGATIAGFDLDPEGIETLKAELDAAGARHHLVPLDITDRPGILEFRDTVLEKFQRVDTVLSNVGIGFFGPFEEVVLEDALKCLEINVIGAAAVFQAFLPSMREKGTGKLIAMSSLVAQVPFPFESIYSASKFALEGLVLSLRYEVEPFGIHVALIEPGDFKTSITNNRIKASGTGEHSPYADRYNTALTLTENEERNGQPPDKLAVLLEKIITHPSPKVRYTIGKLEQRFSTLYKRWAPASMYERSFMKYYKLN